MDTKLFELIDRTDDSVTIAFKDANLTIVTPVMRALDDDPAVELVRFIETHPELDARKLYVNVSEGDPVAALRRASDSVAAYFSELNITASPEARSSSAKKGASISVGD